MIQFLVLFFLLQVSSKPAESKQASEAGKRKGETGGTHLLRKADPKTKMLTPSVHGAEAKAQSLPGISLHCPPAVYPQENQLHSVTGGLKYGHLSQVPPPSLPLLHRGVTGALPTYLSPDAPSCQPSHPSRHLPAAMQPSSAVPLDQPSTHHLQSGIFNEFLAPQEPDYALTASPAPPPFPVAIPLWAPQLLPSREAPYCVHVEEKKVESARIHSEKPPLPKVSDACMQTSGVFMPESAMHAAEASTHLVVEKVS